MKEIIFIVFQQTIKKLSNTFKGMLANESAGETTS